MHPRRAALRPQAGGSRRFYHSGLTQGESSKAFSRVPRRAGQPRAIEADRQQKIGHALSAWLLAMRPVTSVPPSIRGGCCRSREPTVSSRLIAVIRRTPMLRSLSRAWAGKENGFPCYIFRHPTKLRPREKFGSRSCDQVQLNASGHL